MNMMRPSIVVFLLFLFLLRDSQGIRLDKGFKQVDQQEKIHEEKSSSIERSNNNIGVEVGEVIVCKEGQYCSKGRNRKLLTDLTTTSTTPTTTTTSKNEKINGENKVEPKSKLAHESNEGKMGHDQEHRVKTSSTSPTPPKSQEMKNDDHYVDLMDIAEMDYSPARRKPPIHN